MWLRSSWSFLFFMDEVMTWPWSSIVDVAVLEIAIFIVPTPFLLTGWWRAWNLSRDFEHLGCSFWRSLFCSPFHGVITAWNCMGLTCLCFLAVLRILHFCRTVSQPLWELQNGCFCRDFNWKQALIQRTAFEANFFFSLENICLFHRRILVVFMGFNFHKW